MIPLLVLFGLAGCADNVPVRDAADSDRTDLEHDHGVPDHKPRTFAEAVRQLGLRERRLAVEWQAGHADHAAAQLQELRDVVGWLPELAADTDLKFAEWNQVRQHAQELQSCLLRWSATAEGPSSEETAKYLQAVDQLRPLADLTEPQAGSPVGITESPTESASIDQTGN